MLWQTRPTTGNGHTFIYGPGDERLWAIDWTAGTAASSWVSTWTLRDLDGAPLRQLRNVGENTTTANWSFHRDYVYRGGALLAAHTPEGLHHFHLDHLGSPRLITAANGTTLAQHLYFPFGEEATNPAQDDEALKFTGHERDDLDSGGTTSDLDYMHARYFSAHLGKFHSPDPVDSASLPNPQSWNKYGYVRGNPLKYLDPTGEVEIHFTFNSFIPMEKVSVPFAGTLGGDGPGFSAGRTSFRTQQVVVIETDPSVSADPLVRATRDVGITRRYNSEGEVVQTGEASKVGLTAEAQRLADGTVLLKVRGHAKNPLVWFAPAIDYSYRISITPDGKILCLNCSHDQFPAYDAYLTVTRRKPQPLFQHGPLSGWFAALALNPLSPNRSFSELLYEGGYWLDGVYVPQ